MSDRQKLFYALLVSAFFHLVLGVVLALWSAQHAIEAAKTPPDQSQPPDLSPLTVTIMPPRPANAVVAGQQIRTAPTPLPKKPELDDLDSDGLTTSTKAPAKATFQSDSNMVAGSQLPATGSEPLPSLAGPQRTFEDFADRAQTTGKGQQPTTPTQPRRPVPAAQAQPPQPIAQARNASTPAPTVKPTPVPKTLAQTTPQPTPKPAPSAAPDTLSLGKPTPPPATPTPTPVEMAKLNLTPALRGSAEVASPEKAAEAARPPQPEPSTQREMEKTRINGGITNRGAPGVDAIQTPYGRYHQVLSNLISSRWHMYVRDFPKDVGAVTIVVKLNTSGKVVGTKVTANHSLDGLAELSTRAIVDSQLPPVPDDLAPMLTDGKLEISFNFNVYDASHDSPGR